MPTLVTLAHCGVRKAQKRSKLSFLLERAALQIMDGFSNFTARYWFRETPARGKLLLWTARQCMWYRHIHLCTPAVHLLLYGDQLFVSRFTALLQWTLQVCIFLFLFCNFVSINIAIVTGNRFEITAAGSTMYTFILRDAEALAREIRALCAVVFHGIPEELRVRCRNIILVRHS